MKLLILSCLLFATSLAQTDRRLLNGGRSCGGVDCNANGDENAFCIYSDHCSCSYDAGFMCEGGVRSGSECQSGFSCVQSGSRQLGESCEFVFGIGDVGGCAEGLTCACVGPCADPLIMDAPSTCVAGDTDEINICCLAMTADCLACAAGQSVEAYCAAAGGNIPGCPREEQPCCRTMTADCLACAVGQTVEAYCAAAGGNIPGCPREEQPCCRAMTADCLACAVGQSVEEYCAEAEENIPGCPREEQPNICCRAMTADCLACVAGQTIKEYCDEANENIVGCPREESYDELPQSMMNQLRKAFTRSNMNQKKLRKSWNKIRTQLEKVKRNWESGRKRYDPAQMNILNQMHQLLLQEIPTSTDDAQWVAMTGLWEMLMELVNAEEP